jgi:hypothetical protein
VADGAHPLGCPRGPALLVTNLICAAGKGATAILDFQPGFVRTNVLWVAVSAAGLARVLDGRLNSQRYPNRIATAGNAGRPVATADAAGRISLGL